MNIFMAYSETVNTIKYIEYIGIHWNTMRKKRQLQRDTLNYNEKKKWIQWNTWKYIEIY